MPDIRQGWAGRHPLHMAMLWINGVDSSLESLLHHLAQNLPARGGIATDCGSNTL